MYFMGPQLRDILLGTMHYRDSLDLSCKNMTHTYMICHEVTVEIKFIKQVLENVIKRAFGELNYLFQDE